MLMSVSIEPWSIGGAGAAAEFSIGSFVPVARGHRLYTTGDQIHG